MSLVPIFERMEVCRWWTDRMKEEFPLVWRYWEEIQRRKGYQASKPDMETQAKLDKIGKTIDQWKKEHKWFNDFYEM